MLEALGIAFLFVTGALMPRTTLAVVGTLVLGWAIWIVVIISIFAFLLDLAIELRD